MPRVKKTAAALPQADPPLTNCQIAFVRLNAVGIDGYSKATLETQISAQGGSLVTKIESCTHLIATLEQYEKGTGRVKLAIAHHDVKIVTFDWLKQSLTSSSKVDEAQYLLHNHDQKSDSDVQDKPVSNGKRGRAATDDGDTGSVSSKKIKPENGDAQSDQKAGIANIPIDDGIENKAGFKVVIGDDGTIYDVTLNQTNAGHNNNKFYRIQLLEDGAGKHWCWTRWGRVGERGQMRMLGNGDFEFALKEFGKKFKDKNGNSWDNRLAPVKSGKYSFIERSYEDSDDEEDAASKSLKPANVTKENGIKEEDDEEKESVKSKLPEAVQSLMKLIFNQEYFDSTLASLDYDANKMPLGKLSKNTLLRGYTVLKDLTASIGSAPTQDIQDLSNQYFSLIPHAFGRNRPPVLGNMAMIKKEIELLESLTDMQLANDIMKNAKSKKAQTGEIHELDRQFNGLSMQEMTLLDQKSTEFSELENYLKKSGGHTHGIRYTVQDIFRIERQGERSRFDKSKFSKIQNSDRRLLWHGSRCTNFGGILSQGLRIAPPEAPVSGYMFGKGVYLADMSSKSAGYCCAYNSGGIGLLLLCEAELGTPPLKLTDSNYNAGEDAVKSGSISTWGVGQTAPQRWKDAACVNDNLNGISMPDVVAAAPGPTNEDNAYLMYNEYIIYDVAQVKLRYLFRCQMN